MGVKHLQSAGLPRFVALKIIQRTIFSKIYKNFIILIFDENFIGEVKKFILQKLILPYVVICAN